MIRDAFVVDDIFINLSEFRFKVEREGGSHLMNLQLKVSERYDFLMKEKKFSSPLKRDWFIYFVTWYFCSFEIRISSYYC